MKKELLKENEELKIRIKKLEKEKKEIFYILNFEDIETRFNEIGIFPTREELENDKDLVLRKYEEHYSSEIVDFLVSRKQYEEIL